MQTATCIQECARVAPACPTTSCVCGEVYLTLPYLHIALRSLRKPSLPACYAAAVPKSSVLLSTTNSPARDHTPSVHGRNVIRVVLRLGRQIPGAPPLFVDPVDPALDRHAVVVKADAQP